MKKNIIYTVLIALVASIGFSSCEDMFSPDMDRHDEIDQVAADTLYSYWGILKSLQSVAERYVVLGECRGDLVAGTEYISDSIHAILDFQTDQPTAADGACRYLKASDYYHIINSCNAYISRCDTLRKTGTDRSYMLKEYAQVVSIRAWVYMQLILAYQRVPYLETPVLSTADIENFRNAPAYIDINTLASSSVVQKLEEVRKVDYPNYGTYQQLVHSTMCLFPQNLVLGDIYLLTAQQGDKASYIKAAQCYYDYLNSEWGGVIQTNSYFGTLQRNEITDQFVLGVSNWGNMFQTTSEVTANQEVVTVIPSSLSKLFGSVQRGIQQLFGFDSEISVRTNAEDTITTVAVSLTANFKHELGASKAYEQLNLSQDYEAYIGNTASDAICKVIPGAGDARYQMTTNYRPDPDSDDSKTVNFVMKQNHGGNASVISGNFRGSLTMITFPTSYPIIYRKGNIWLRFAEAINGAGFPGYAFAILKSGLCGNPDWVPTERTRYDVDEMAYYALEGGQRKKFTSADDRLDSYIQRAVTDGVIFSEDPDTIAKQLKTYLADNDITFGQDTISLCPWPSESFNSNLVCNHISKRETQEAKNYSFFTFQTEKNYLRGTSTSYNSYIGNTDKQIGNSYHSDLFNNDLLTTGIHTRGCGRIKPWESQTTFNYVNQINKMLAADGEAPMTKKEIYADENLDKVQQAIAHLILDELALETAFEGNRFYDLVCYSRFLGGTKGVNAVADMIANRGGSLDNALKTRLQDQNNWYFKLPAK